ncbi:hypothetical protein [Saccharopolyspora sp. ASAGF58]|uniref:WXG100-like domain-containing protein n=1 Tax=Saccharopolyspora sp. ASAGF58 TaxID=2719023 RepID=UPI001440059D|nr:hypothetical protein [Saccharopolyspora sp. ASAGF58]QIZ36211.1 hypothetical protein FDZ84_17900 [Saccharopolyspora sp. ASAGF58]
MGKNGVMSVYETLTGSLRGLSGAAGNDDPAEKFAESYMPAVRNIAGGLVRLHELLGGISRGLVESAEAHRLADANAAGTDPGAGLPPLWADKCPAATEPPSILGDGDTNLLAVISDWVNPYYPNGQVTKMHDVAAAFAAARDGLTAVAGELQSVVQALVGNNTSEDLDALDEFWRRVAVNDGALLAELPAACDAVANACSEYASSVEHIRNKIGDIVEETSLELAAVTGIAFVASLLTTPVGGAVVEGGAGAAVLDAAGVRIAAVAAEFVLAISGAVAIAAAVEATAALAMAINNTPDPNVAQTTASEVTSQLGRQQTSRDRRHQAKSPHPVAVPARWRTSLQSRRPTTRGTSRNCPPRVTPCRSKSWKTEGHA